MKVLQLCPLWFPISLNAPGGRETFMTQLIPALKNLDYQITLIASGDSTTSAELLPVVPRHIVKQMEESQAWEYVYYEQQQLHLALERAADYDVVHSHLGSGAFVLSSVPGLTTPVLHTIHTPVYKDLEWFISQNPHLWLSTVSAFQARKLWNQGASRCHVIPNGIDVSSFIYRQQGGESLLFLGRLERFKGPDLAIQVAQSLGRPLILAGPIIEEDFFRCLIKPQLSNTIQYYGVVNHQQKNVLLSQVGCLLMPVRGDEGFGLTAIEAMACGTPVVALYKGALPEVIDAGLTGYLGRDEHELAPLVTQAMRLDRARIRSQVMARFDIAMIAEQYDKLYKQIAT